MEFATHFSRPTFKGLEFNQPSLVQPQYQRDADINVLVRRALGGDPSAFVHGSQFVDASESPEDFHALMNEQKRAERVWDSLPDAVKRSYGNISEFVAAVDAARSAESARASEPAPSPAMQAENSTSKSVPTT